MTKLFALLIVLNLSLIQYSYAAEKNVAKSATVKEQQKSSKSQKEAKGYVGPKMHNANIDASAAKKKTDTKSTDVSMLELFFQASFIVKCVILMLFAASLFVWSIFINKIIMIRRVEKQIDKFDHLFWSGKSLDEIIKYTTQAEYKSPNAELCTAAFHEMNKSSKSAFSMERFNNSRDLILDSFTTSLTKNINYLATISSAAPFIGLFGTVWGIMTSFQAIAASKNTNLAVVAPGIAEALFATALGLIAAIPALIFYNELSQKIKSMEDRIFYFGNEIINILLKDQNK